MCDWSETWSGCGYHTTEVRQCFAVKSGSLSFLQSYAWTSIFMHNFPYFHLIILEKEEQQYGIYCLFELF